MSTRATATAFQTRTLTQSSVAREEPDSDDNALTVGVVAAETVAADECVAEAVADPVRDAGTAVR